MNLKPLLCLLFLATPANAPAPKPDDLMELFWTRALEIDAIERQGGLPAVIDFGRQHGVDIRRQGMLPLLLRPKD